jgi:hypothetical protein
MIFISDWNLIDVVRAVFENNAILFLGSIWRAPILEVDGHIRQETTYDEYTLTY